MKTMTGGQLTGQGVYVGLRTGEFVTIPKEGGELPGKETVAYIKIPAALAAVLGPILGLTYVIFLPLVGLITLGWLISRLAARAATELRIKVGQLTGAEWQPGMSYFARRRKAGKQQAVEGTLEQLHKEIEQKKLEK
ncbi:MAG: hypothetical protein Q7T05_01985 [Dehalococcoidia bacterium]|nr:hypothetical protein [Dehalococcoidia bacterium]